MEGNLRGSNPTRGAAPVADECRPKADQPTTQHRHPDRQFSHTLRPPQLIERQARSHHTAPRPRAAGVTCGRQPPGCSRISRPPLTTHASAEHPSAPTSWTAGDLCDPANPPSGIRPGGGTATRSQLPGSWPWTTCHPSPSRMLSRWLPPTLGAPRATALRIPPTQLAGRCRYQVDFRRAPPAPWPSRQPTLPHDHGLCPALAGGRGSARLQNPLADLPSTGQTPNTPLDALLR